MNGRLVLARALGVFLGLLALAMLWNGIDTLRFAKTGLEYVLMVFQLLSAPPLALSAYWLWKRDRRAIWATAIGMSLCTVVGTFAATYWTEPSERWSAGLGALGASIVLLIVIVWLARFSLKTPTSESAPEPH
ncbi:MAG TPA: hypothetical protein VGQ52_00140 [Gemmatimonadaceae bacterium]|nr:hypothetical protein [Gemmatimonadaceae bacterium]